MDVAEPQLEHLLSVQELAEFLQVPIATLYQWRHLGRGPRVIKVGRYLRYDMNDVQEWLGERTG